MSDEVNQLLDRIKTESDIFAKAKLIQSLKTSRQIPLHQISTALNVKPAYISHILRLLKLPPLIIDGYYAQQIPISHLFIIARLANKKQMVELYEKILSENLTTLQTDQLVREALYEIKSEGKYISKGEIGEFLKKISGTGLKIKVIQTRIKGKFIVEVDGSLAKTSYELRRLIKLFESLRQQLD